MLVVLTVGSILLSVAASDWSYLVRSERERELIFRGVQIARAVDEWQQDPGRGGNPTTLEVMTKPPKPVLRKQYVDPITAKYGDDGELVEGTGLWTYIPLDAPQGNAPRASGATGAPTAATATATARSGLSSRTPQVVPFIGVQSTSDELSIGSYLDSAPESPYSDWKFRAQGLNRSLRQEGGYELPRPGGFGGLRLPGGPPTRTLGATGATGATGLPQQRGR